MSNSDNVKNLVKRRKNDLIEVLGGKCCICGFNQFIQALEFHHVHPEEKLFGISSSTAATRSLEAKLQELKKCILVCANCHRGIHYGFCTVPENWQDLYQESIAERLRQEKAEVEQITYHYCLDCGAKISRWGTRCEKCSLLASRKVKNRPSREELKDLIRSTPFTALGAQYGVSDNAVRKWCKACGLPSKANEIKKYNDIDWANI